MQINCSHPINQVFELATRQSINSSLLRTKIHSALEEFPSRETRAVFLEISKAFDKVWHDGLRFKLKNCGISGSLFTVIKDFLSNRHQRVV